MNRRVLFGVRLNLRAVAKPSGFLLPAYLTHAAILQTAIPRKHQTEKVEFFRGLRGPVPYLSRAILTPKTRADDSRKSAAFKSFYQSA